MMTTRQPSLNEQNSIGFCSCSPKRRNSLRLANLPLRCEEIEWDRIDSIDGFRQDDFMLDISLNRSSKSRGLGCSFKGGIDDIDLFGKLRREKEAAITIQALIRGLLSRRFVFRNSQLEAQIESEIRKKNITMIQAIARGFLQRLVHRTHLLETKLGEIEQRRSSELTAIEARKKYLISSTNIDNLNMMVRENLRTIECLKEEKLSILDEQKEMSTQCTLLRNKNWRLEEAITRHRLQLAEVKALEVQKAELQAREREYRHIFKALKIHR